MNLISLDIRMLRSLISVVETGSITETARRLGRTQPAITLQLQRLEEPHRQAAVRAWRPQTDADRRRQHRPHLRQIHPEVA
ncbi:helix-turn-helix domain-containing protein [Bradyrhizobium guangxiense]